MNQVVVIDNGSDETKVGFAGENAPRFIFPSLFGYAKRVFFATDKKYYYPDEALQNLKDCKLRYAIKDGAIWDFTALEKIWKFSFKRRLQIDSSLYPVLLTELPNLPDIHREKMAEIMFEIFKVPALCIKSQDFLISYAAKTSSQIKEKTAWIGGSLFASQDDALQHFISIDEYNREGPVLIHRCKSNDG